MKVASGNIRQNLPVEVALSDIDRVVTEYRPDALCLQEATVDRVQDASTGYLGHIATRYGLEPSFAQTRHFQLKTGDIHSGVATLLSDALEENSTTQEIELQRQSVTTKHRPIGRRALLITRIEAGERPLTLVNVHLTYPNLRFRRRRQEWQRVFTAIDELPGDVVISGDFNARPRSSFIRECNRRWKQISDQTVPTFHGLYKWLPKHFKTRTLDYVFTNKACQRPVTAEQLPLMHSDHQWHLITID
jgi:endonuclease/exonuclease/phosphatase family metal-dependent hydrolase